ncbi:hypothetical protein NQL31_001456 [Lotmaria passim]
MADALLHKDVAEGDLLSCRIVLAAVVLHVPTRLNDLQTVAQPGGIAHATCDHLIHFIEVGVAGLILVDGSLCRLGHLGLDFALQQLDAGVHLAQVF